MELKWKAPLLPQPSSLHYWFKKRCVCSLLQGRFNQTHHPQSFFFLWCWVVFVLFEAGKHFSFLEIKISWQPGYKVSQPNQKGHILFGPHSLCFPPLHFPVPASFSSRTPWGPFSCRQSLSNVAEYSQEIKVKNVVANQVCMKPSASWWWRERNSPGIVKKLTVTLQS